VVGAFLSYLSSCSNPQGPRVQETSQKRKEKEENYPRSAFSSSFFLLSFLIRSFQGPKKRLSADPKKDPPEIPEFL